MKRTKIIATIGPASRSPECLKSILRAGMDVARMNFSHGTESDHENDHLQLRRVAEEEGIPLAILQDLSGPKIRIGPLEGGKPVTLAEGASVELSYGNDPGNAKRIYTSYEAIADEVSPGGTILIDDAKLALGIESISKGVISCSVHSGGELRENKGINLPGARLSASAPTEKDIRDLTFGLRLGFDMVALSFVKTGDDIQRLKSQMGTENHAIPVIAKIERPEALDNMDEILEAADGVMIARGDLGVEISPERVPAIQKDWIAACNRIGKPVITATQMLESMVSNHRPTRAEASDVANAIYDGSDAVMLSQETAIGRYPVQSVEMMARIARQTERDLKHLERNAFSRTRALSARELAIGRATCQTAADLKARVIVCFTMSGSTAAIISSLRPNADIIAATPDPQVRRRLQIYWGIHSILVDAVDSTDRMIESLDRTLLEEELVQHGETVVISAGAPLQVRGNTNMMKIHLIGSAF